MAATVCFSSLLNSLLDFAPLFFHNLVFASARVRQLSRFRNPGHFLLVESGIQAFRVWISSRRLECRILVPLTRNSESMPGIWNTHRGIQNSKLSWIHLNDAICKSHQFLTRTVVFESCY